MKYGATRSHARAHPLDASSHACLSLPLARLSPLSVTLSSKRGVFERSGGGEMRRPRSSFLHMMWRLQSFSTRCGRGAVSSSQRGQRDPWRHRVVIMRTMTAGIDHSNGPRSTTTTGFSACGLSRGRCANRFSLPPPTPAPITNPSPNPRSGATRSSTPQGQHIPQELCLLLPC